MEKVGSAILSLTISGSMITTEALFQKFKDFADKDALYDATTESIYPNHIGKDGVSSLQLPSQSPFRSHAHASQTNYIVFLKQKYFYTYVKSITRKVNLSSKERPKINKT